MSGLLPHFFSGVGRSCQRAGCGLPPGDSVHIAPGDKAAMDRASAAAVQRARELGAPVDTDSAARAKRRRVKRGG